jgi:hypothetical protein
MTIYECQKMAEYLYGCARESTIAGSAVTFQLIAAGWSQLARGLMFGEEA